MAPPFGFNASFKTISSFKSDKKSNKSRIVPIDNKQGKELPSLRQQPPNKQDHLKHVLVITDDDHQKRAQQDTATVYFRNKAVIQTISSTRPSPLELFGAHTSDFVLINYQSQLAMETILKYLMPDDDTLPLIIGINPQTNDALQQAIKSHLAQINGDTASFNKEDDTPIKNFIHGWYAAPNTWRFLKTEGYLQNQYLSYSYSGSTPRSDSPEEDELLKPNISVDDCDKDNKPEQTITSEKSSRCSLRWCSFFCRDTDTKQFDSTSPDTRKSGKKPGDR